MAVEKRKFIVIRDNKQDFCIVIARTKTDAHRKAYKEFRETFRLQRVHEDQGHALLEQGYEEHDLSPLEVKYDEWNEDELPRGGTGGGARHTETGSGNKS